MQIGHVTEIVFDSDGSFRLAPSDLSDPAGWQIDCADDHVDRPRAGTVGVWALSAGAKYWDDFSVSPLTLP